MSFRIHAAGTGGFRHQRNWTDEGDVYDLASAMSLAASTSGGVRGVATEYGTSRVLGLTDATSDSPVQRATRTVGTLTCMHTLNDAFTLALAERSRMQIAVTAQSPSSMPFFPDVGGHLRYTYDSRDNFYDFMCDLTPKLEAANLNRFTVLCALAEAFALWPHHGTRGIAMLVVQLTGT
ncbi:MAG: hypothetical protein JY451_02350 [Erythrobacter sp.]|nr:MAG: hypothetical protein JY451_02350 [Erythrobacter sp.]